MPGRAQADLLTSALSDPSTLAGLSLPGWDLLIRQARSSGLLGRLGALASERAVAVPERPARHLRWAAREAEACHGEIRCEVAWVAEALASAGVRPLLLKGAAYVMAGLPAAAGRFFEDIDVLVPRERLGIVESRLQLAGWMPKRMDAYDQRYYRRWMHELPPMQHVERGTTVDVHFNILPETGRVRVDPAQLLERAQPIPDGGRLWTLCAPDMVLHSAAHLFHDGEFTHALRDLSDLDRLLRHFGERPGFWADLTARAHGLGLGHPLFYALALCTELLATPVPEPALDQASAQGPQGVARRAMLAALREGLRPDHGSCRSPVTPLARQLLFLRSHWLKMPLWRLTRHLVRKAWLRREPVAER